MLSNLEMPLFIRHPEVRVVRIQLTAAQMTTLNCLIDAMAELEAAPRAVGDRADVEELARVKKYAEEFLAYPLIQALSTEGR